MLRTDKQHASGRVGLGRRAALLVAAGSLVCAMGVGFAFASDAAEEPAEDAAAVATEEAEEATGDAAEPSTTNPTANAAASHAARGVVFEDLADSDTEGKTAEEISAGIVGTREFCLSCHNWDDIVDSTVLPGDVTVYNKDGMYNVHDNHDGLLNCSDCHSVVEDEPSELFCVNCHYMELPEGWEGFY